MTHKLKIFKNSVFLSIQPIFMNVISLFVVGYIARKLGKSDFGIFNFVITFTMLFYPVAMMGLNRITVRDMAGSKNVKLYASYMMTLRLITTLIAIFIIILFTRILAYSNRVTTAMYLACFIFTFQTLLEMVTDAFNAGEKMEFTAFTKMVAGLILTVLSVIVLYLGFGLYGLLGSYIFGQMIGFILGSMLLVSFFFSFRFKLNGTFIKKKLKEGFPFFLMTIMWYAMARLDTIFLSKKVSMAEMGLYTSALLLITKSSIIPQGVANSLLPAISALYSKNKMYEINDVVHDFLSKIILFALPMVIIISFFSYEIIDIVFGNKYHEGGLILRIGIWAFFLRCIMFVEFSILTAIREQNRLIKSYMLSFVFSVIANIFLVYHFGSIGAVSAFVLTHAFLFIMFTFSTLKTLENIFCLNEILKIALLNIILVVMLVFFDSYNFILISFLASIMYMLGSHFLKLFPIGNLLKMKEVFKVA